MCMYIGGCRARRDLYRDPDRRERVRGGRVLGHSGQLRGGPGTRLPPCQVSDHS